MKLLVLAGGLGTRLQSVLTTAPKALAPVGAVPFLRLQLEHWINQGLRSFVFLLHHQADQIIDFLLLEQHALLKDCEIEWLVESAPMGTGGALAHAVKQLDLTEDFLVVNADTWLNSGIVDMLGSVAPAMAVIKLSDTSRYGQVQFNDQFRVNVFSEKNGSIISGWINAGLWRFKAEMFHDWDGLPFSLERIIFPKLVERGILSAVLLETDFIDIGIPSDYFRFCKWIELGRKGKLCS
jgi:D-glycero-alpha-D-manno-heptose 1-phosphate guanylyltransferase